MPAHCPEGFDAKVWENVKEEELNDNFLLLLANELKKLEAPIIDVCNCLDIQDSSFVQEVSSSEKITCYNYHKVLGEWRHLTGNEVELVGKLLFRLSKLKGMSCESLSSLCVEFFKSQGILLLYQIHATCFE